MRKTFIRLFAALIVCLTLSIGAMAGDISSGFAGDISSGSSSSLTGDISSGLAGDISSGKSLKDNIIEQVVVSLTGILLGE